MRKVSRIAKEEGVSPVIATILMVAITVVLAAVLYVIVSDLMRPVTPPKNIAVGCVKIGMTNSYKCTVASADNGVDFTQIAIKVQKSNGDVVSSWSPGFALSGGIAENNSASTPVFSGKVVDNGDGAFGISDDVYLAPVSGQSLVGLSVKFSGGGANGAGSIA